MIAIFFENNLCNTVKVIAKQFQLKDLKTFTSYSLSDTGCQKSLWFELLHSKTDNLIA